MLDKERILMKVDALDNYLKELAQIIPGNFTEYQKIEIKRSAERLLQLSIECIIDICNLFVSGLKLGLPSEENDLFDKMQKEGLITKNLHSLLKKMKGLRNILVHEYAEVDDELIFRALKTKLNDFMRFKKQILKVLK